MDCCRQNITSEQYESDSDSDLLPENISTDVVTRGGETNKSSGTVKRTHRPLYGFWAHSCRSGYKTEDGKFITTMMKKFFKLLE